MRKALGVALIALPFAAWLVFALVSVGWMPTALILLFIAVVAACMFTGGVLLDG
jgi:hypothetical protein